MNKKIRTALLLHIYYFIVFLSGCSSSNVDIIKENAKKTWESNGFKVVGYQGYEWSGFGAWGGCVWYTVERGTTTYDGCISKWGEEFHIYNLTALDAIKAH